MFREKPAVNYTEGFYNLAADPQIPYLSKEDGLRYEEYFDSDTKTKLQIILTAEEHILSLEDGKKRYIDEVTALSKAFALSLPQDQAMDAKDEIALFQAIKSRLIKFRSHLQWPHC